MTSSIRRWIASLCMVLVASPAAVRAAEPVALDAAAQERLRAALASLVVPGPSPGFALAVVEHGRTVFTFAGGDANLATGAPITPETAFHIGSITKLFTAVAIMQQVAAGTIALDAPIGTYLPGLSHGDEVTVRQLLMQRSGIPNYLDDALAAHRVVRPTTPQEIVRSMLAQPLEFRPGSAFEYSNTNFVLLGLILERVTGVPYARYLREHVFVPAGMTRTSVGAPPDGLPLAIGYTTMQPGGTTADPGDPSWYYACGDGISTVGDLARFDVALMNGTLLPPAFFAQMASGALPMGDGSGGSYGFGIMTIRLGDRLVVGHHGGMPGYEGDDLMIPADGFAIVTLSNAFDFTTGRAEQPVWRTAYPQQYAAAVAATHAVPDAYPALTMRFTAFVRGLLEGKQVDSHLTLQMRAVLAPNTIREIDDRLLPEGRFQGLEFRGMERVSGGYRVFHYLAHFAQGVLPMTFTLDADGALAGFFLQ